MSDRIPVEGITVDAEPHPLGEYALRGPTGEVLMWATAADLADLGISVPPKPFTDPLGIGLTEKGCERAVGLARRWPTGLNIEGKVGEALLIGAAVGRALLAAGYDQDDDR